MGPLDEDTASLIAAAIGYTFSQVLADVVLATNCAARDGGDFIAVRAMTTEAGRIVQGS
jgi:hypothetical protein